MYKKFFCLLLCSFLTMYFNCKHYAVLNDKKYFHSLTMLLCLFLFKKYNALKFRLTPPANLLRPSLPSVRVIPENEPVHEILPHQYPPSIPSPSLLYPQMPPYEQPPHLSQSMLHQVVFTYKFYCKFMVLKEIKIYIFSTSDRFKQRRLKLYWNQSL